MQTALAYQLQLAIQSARFRVASDRELYLHRGILLEYHGQNKLKHFERVANAPVEQLVQWCDKVERSTF